MQKSRTYNSILNSCIGIVSAIVNITLNFAVRVAIVRILGEDINGIHSLFQSIMTVLAVMETSLTTAMIMHLYSPMKNNEQVTISKLLNIYKGLYKTLAVVVFVATSIINLGLGTITTTIDESSIHFYFGIFSLSYVISYLTYSYRCVLYGEQKNRISVIATTIAEIIFRGLGIVLICITHKYWLFVVCLVFEKLIGNKICKYYVIDKHSFLRKSNNSNFDLELKKSVISSVKPLIINQVATALQNSSTSIIIGIVLKKIAVVGYYGNYQLVIGAINVLFSQIGAAFTSSFGNLAAGNNKRHMQSVYKKIHIIFTFGGVIFSCGFLCCIKDFIVFSFGENYLLNISTSIFLTISMFVSIINVPLNCMQNATGTHKLDAIYMVIQAISSILLSCIGGLLFGINGIIVGGLLPNIMITMLRKGIILSKQCLEMEGYEYVKLIMKSIVVFSITIAITFDLTSCISITIPLLSFVVKGIISVFVSTTITAFAYRKEIDIREMIKF